MNLDVIYPYQPQRVWEVLTDSRALAAWLMENNFEPKVGHRFQFKHTALPGTNVTDADDSEKDITLYINSPGGSVL